MPVDVEQRVGGGFAEQGAPVQDHLQDPLTRPNKTGLPDRLKSGIESLSGYSMDDVKVHYNSAKPAQLQAHAYAQGTNIHVASGQERHLAHEAWHVVQQKQGRVEPTRQFKGGPTNESSALEVEADAMGAKAASGATGSRSGALRSGGTAGAVTQLRRATSRGNNPRTYVLPQAVKDHIFTNNHDGTGFHATTREQPKIAKVRQIDGRDRGAEAYRARHRNNANTADVGPEKSMFPDNWTRDRVVDVIQRALTRPDVNAATAVRIGQQGNTEQDNRPLPEVQNGRVRGRADGVSVEGIMGQGELATVYPRV